jgi:hypothetical protein
MEAEQPRDREYSMLESVLVMPKGRHETLSEMSRVNFAKLYIAEHNLKSIWH